MRITSEDLAHLIPVEDIPGVIESALVGSQLLPLMTRLPNMASKTAQMSVASALPVTFWQGTNIALKRLTKEKWEGKNLVANEIAVIIPIAINDLRDANIDILAKVKDAIKAQAGLLIDQTILNGEGGSLPTGFPEGLIKQATTKGYFINETSDRYADIDKAMKYVEKNGYRVTGLIGGVELDSMFRNLRDSTGQPIQNTQITSLPRVLLENGAWDPSKASLIAGALKECVWATRQDLEFTVLDQAVITDPDNPSVILYNLAQQDMIAIRATLRFAWQIPNPVNQINQVGGARLPLALVVPVASGLTEGVTLFLEPGAATTFEGSQLDRKSVV